MLTQIRTQAEAAIAELISAAKCNPGDIIVIGCSTSEVAGHKIGTVPAPEIAAALLEGLLPQTQKNGLFLAAQCCEHLERALVIEQDAITAHRLVQVNAIPQPKAGGSFATAAWQSFKKPVLVKEVKAHAGLDIGQTLIGMHIRPVVVPVRLGTTAIGHAGLSAARSRLPFVGGSRAVYDEALL